MSNEFERIARIRRALDRNAPNVLVANGDDAAVYSFEGHSVVSVDTCIENTHFRSGWLSYEDLGWRSQVSALSDLTAMGARSRFVVIALGAPKDFSDESIDALSRGVAAALDSAGAVLIGGNVSASNLLSITTTAIGEANEVPVLRSGARVGDELYVTGPLGGAGLGLDALLQAGSGLDTSSETTHRWRRPPLRTNLAQAIARDATACIDISDGLGQDLGHLAQASQVGFEIDATILPLAEGVSSNKHGYLTAWRSGEEYELLFTASAPPSFEAFAIGRACEQPGLRLIADGELINTDEALGFDHFR